MILDLKFNGKIRLWFEEDNEVKFQGDNIIHKDFQINSIKTEKKKIVIAEIFLPRGGRNIYGLLGVDYNAYDSEVLKVTLNSTTRTAESIYNSIIIKNIESVYVGFPAEYNQYILTQVESHCINKKLILNGELNFQYAAFSEISSNGWIFNKLTDILLFHLQADNQEINSDIIMKILS